jgi:flavodoxin
MDNKKIIALVLFIMACALGIIVSLSSCKGQKKTAENETEEEEVNVLVAYFSATGNTRRVAKLMVESIYADELEILPAQPYTEADLDWRDKQSRSTLEMNDTTARPEIVKPEIDLDKYDLIYLGYPIWWGVAPRIINTFLETVDLSGKQIVPFCTSGGSPVEPSVEALRKSYPNLDFEDGLLLNNIGEDGLTEPEEPEQPAE